MNKSKKFILIIGTIVLIIISAIIIILIFMIKNQNNYQESNILKEEQEKFLNTLDNPAQSINGKKPEELKFESLYFTVDSCINKYIKYLIEQNPLICKLIDEQYINENGINEQNVYDKIPTYNNSYRTSQMYSITGVTYSTYYVKGTDSNKNIYLIVNTDDINKSFSILPIDEQTFNSKINETIETSEKYEKEITNNSYNTISYQYFSEQDIVEKYFQDYLNNMLYDIEKAYEFLNDEYRENRFKSMEDFQNYIQSNQSKMLKMCKNARKQYTDFSTYEEYEEYYRTVSNFGLSKYSIEETENGKRYICIDSYGNNYIFNVSSIMQYSVILDTYTLDLPEFIEKYDSGNDETKLTLNVGKVIEAINNKDYEYVYNKLNETFRNNNFSDISIFEKFIENNFYEINEVVEFSYKQEGNVYVCTMGLKNKENSSDNLKSVTILIQLLDNRNFEISFSV